MKFDQHISLDWLSFTLPYSDLSMQRAVYLGDGYESEEMSYGRFQYNASIRILDGGNIYFNLERKDMGIHVALNSASLSLLDFRPVQLINLLLDWGATFKRTDIAYDDYEGLLVPDDMYRKILTGEVVTRFRSVTRISGQNLADKQSTGDTINLGKRSSEAFIRIYDKLQEQIAKKKNVPLGVENWVRVELEAKGKKAHAIAELIGNTAKRAGASPGAELAKLLYGLLDFKDMNESDINKARWKTCGFWTEFIGETEKRKLCLPKREKTLEGAKSWIFNQVKTTLAMIILSEDDDNGVSGYDFVMDCVEEGEKKMSKQQNEMLDQFNEAQEEKRRAAKRVIPDYS